MQIHITTLPDMRFEVSVQVTETLAGAIDRAMGNWFYLGSDCFAWDEEPQYAYKSKQISTRVVTGRAHLQGQFADAILNRWVNFLPRCLAFQHAQIVGGKAEGLYALLPTPENEYLVERSDDPKYPMQVFVDGTAIKNRGELDIAIQGIDTVAPLGSFKVESSQIRVTDPCYENEGSAIFLKATPGVWQASTLIGPTAWNRRNKELRIWHESETEAVFTENETAFVRHPKYAGVDSGQCGFFDASKFPDDTAQFECAEGTFYGRCCDTTGKEDSSAVGGGVLPDGVGVLTSSGYGDGGYSVFVLYDDGGSAVAAVIYFISDDDEDDSDPEE